MTTEMNQKGTNVQVAVRMRPLNQEERKGGQPSVVTIDTESKSVKVSYGPTGKKMFKNFGFDKVFGSYSRQEDIFNSVVTPIVDEVLEGYNCTIFAYGQTGTGKTHTMEGDIHSEEHAGIVPRSIKSMLEKLDAKGVEYTVRVSFLELYNEELQDLLASSVDKDKRLKLCEDVKKGVVCQNLEEIAVMDVPTIFDVLQKGIKQRQTAATLCNKNSSRSHSIFTMKLMIKEYNIDGEEVVRHGQMNLVDLAGSECVGRSGATGDRGREAGSINQSLLTLGRVITALVDHHGHVPYRDSKLTRLLQESLGGKAKTCIIATFSPVQSAVEETMSTLDYAYRARAIKNQPCANQKLTKKVVMKEYFAEIESLKYQLALSREKNGVYVEPGQFAAMETRLQSQEDQLIECEGALTIRTAEVKSLKGDKDELVMSLETTTTELTAAQVHLREAETKLEEVTVELEEKAIELQATEAVVGEQVSSELSLVATGQELQADLGARQVEVVQLLNKVDTMVQGEMATIAKTSEFVAQLSSSGTSLISKVEEFQGQSNTQAEKLCDGVATMLIKGRATCSTLTESINQALSSLINDANTARDSMTESCGGLKGHLQSTNSNLETTLRSLQGQLSSWLGEADVNLQRAQEHLKQQKAKAEEMVQSIHSHSIDLQKLDASFVAGQEELKQQASKIVVDLKKDITQTLKAYAESTQTQTQKTDKDLKDKAAAMEKAVQRMLKDMVDSGSAANDQAIADAKAMHTATSKQLVTGTSNLSALSSAIYNSCVNQSGKIAASTGSATTGFIEAMDNMTTAREATNQTICGISATVGQKRKHLDETVTSVVATVGTAIKHGCEEADKTAATAKKLAIDVSNATNKMSSSAIQSMDSFTGFMDQEGENIKGELTNHFSLSATLLSNQSEGMNTMLASAQSYDKAALSSKIQSTGNTPTKASQRKKRMLQQTRDHALIKSEVFASTGRTEKAHQMAAMVSPTTDPMDAEEKVGEVDEKEEEGVSREESFVMDTSPVVEQQVTEEEGPVLACASFDSVASDASNVSNGRKGRGAKKIKSSENTNPNPNTNTNTNTNTNPPDDMLHAKVSTRARKAATQQSKLLQPVSSTAKTASGTL